MRIDAARGEATVSTVYVTDLSHHDPPSKATRRHLACTSASEPSYFPYFSVGETIGDMPVTFAERWCEDRVWPNEVTYVYGTCHGGGETGCAPPLAVESWPACQRNLSQYENPFGGPYPHAKPVRWAAGAISVNFNQGTRVEVYTARSTIVLFGEPDLIAGALGLLRQEPNNGPVHVPAPGAGQPIGIDTLPAPAHGALHGKLRCGRRGGGA